jgi:hypothetical protein
LIEKRKDELRIDGEGEIDDKDHGELEGKFEDKLEDEREDKLKEELEEREDKLIKEELEAELEEEGEDKLKEELEAELEEEGEDKLKEELEAGLEEDELEELEIEGDFWNKNLNLAFAKFKQPCKQSYILTTHTTFAMRTTRSATFLARATTIITPFRATAPVRNTVQAKFLDCFIFAVESVTIQNINLPCLSFTLCFLYLGMSHCFLPAKMKNKKYEENLHSVSNFAENLILQRFWSRITRESNDWSLLSHCFE